MKKNFKPLLILSVFLGINSGYSKDLFNNEYIFENPSDPIEPGPIANYKPIYCKWYDECTGSTWSEYIYDQDDVWPDGEGGKDELDKNCRASGGITTTKRD